MKNTNNGSKLTFLINTTYYLYIFMLIYIVFRYAFKLIYPFVIAVLIGTLVEPFVDVIIKKVKVKRYLASPFCVVTFYLVVFVLVSLISVIVINSIKDFYHYFPFFINTIKSTVENLLQKNSNTVFEKIFSNIYTYISNIDIIKIFSGNIGNAIIKQISDLIKSLPSFALSVIITVISSIFVSLSFPVIKKFILVQLKPKHQKTVKNIKNTITELIKKYLKSYFVILIITFSELLVLFLIFNIEPSFILAVTISIVDILPVFGIGVVLIPWSLYCFFTGNINKAIILISIYFLITVVRQIIEPKIIGDSIGLNPLVTLISIYVGFKLFGILGIITLPIAITFIVELNNNKTINLWKKISIDN